MEIVDNPELNKLMFKYLIDKYKILERRAGLHLSSLVGCLTRSFYDTTPNPIDPTESECMLFVTGYGLQEVLTPKNASTPLYEEAGITYSPDFELALGDYTFELKSTRISASNPDLNENWIEYMLGGCHILKKNTYNLSAIHLMGNYKPPFPILNTKTIIFTDEEIANNWEYLLVRKEVLEEAISNKKPPLPFQHCKEWECKYCRYKMQCEAVSMVLNPSGISIRGGTQ